MASEHPIVRPWAREDGLTSVEYALMIAVIVAVLAGAVFSFVDSVQSRFARDENCAATAYTGSGC